MKRRPLIHLLLALVLLVSQQIGLSHLMSHGTDGSTRLAESGLQSGIKALAKVSPVKLLADQSCQECLFLAQLGAALPSRLQISRQAAADPSAVLAQPADWQSRASPSPFLSRAPPLV